MFTLSDLSSRLLPMVELIDEQNRTVELEALLSASQSPAAARETLPPFDPPARIEPGEPDMEQIGFTRDDVDTSAFAGRETDSDELSRGARGWPADLADSEDLENTSDDRMTSLRAEFDDVAAEPELAGPDSDTSERSFRSDFEDEDFDTYQDERVPVTGPVAPRPLTATAAHEFGDSAVSATSRKKKKSSPVRAILGPILGGILGLAIGGALLEFLGKPLIWPFDGTLSRKMAAGDPMDLAQHRTVPSPRSGRSLSEDLEPESDVAAGDPGDIPSATAQEVAAQEVAAQEVAAQEVAAVEAVPPTNTGLSQPDQEEMDASQRMQSPAQPLTNLAPQPPVTRPSEPLESTTPAAVTLPSDGIDPTKPPGPRPESLSLPPDPMPSAVTMPEPDDAVSSENGDSKQPMDLIDPAAMVSLDAPASPELVAAIKQTDEAIRQVVEFDDPGNDRGLNKSKATLYIAIANVALAAQSASQPETEAIVQRIAEAELDSDMTRMAPVWLRTLNRPNRGIFAVGKIVRKQDEWVLQWNGPADLQLQGVDPTAVQSGDEVVLLGEIVDASPPAIVRVVFLKKHSSN